MKLRLIATTIGAIAILVLLQYFLLHSSKREMPDEAFRLFPRNIKFAFYLDVPALMPLLPPGSMEKLPSIGRALASSSRIYIGQNADFSEVYLALDGSPTLDKIIPLLKEEKIQRLDIAGFRAVSMDGACLVELREGVLFGVFAKDASAKTSTLLLQFDPSRKPFNLNLLNALSKVPDKMLFKACGFPKPLTPPLLPGVPQAYTLQQQTKYFSLEALKSGQTSIFLRLNLYFEQQGARDLLFATLPGMLAGYASKYPFLETLVSQIKYVAGTKDNLRMEITLPREILAPFVNPPPTPAPLIPNVPEFPF